MILATAILSAFTGAVLVALYAKVSDTGGMTLYQLRVSVATGDWDWVTPTVMVGAGLIASSAVGFMLLAGWIVKRGRDKAKDQTGYEVEMK